MIDTGKLLQRNGYRIKIFNTINFKKSMHYNPFAYIHSEKDILKLVAGGGAVYFLKFKKKKPDTKGDADLDDCDYGDEDEDEYSDTEDEPEDGEDN